MASSDEPLLVAYVQLVGAAFGAAGQRCMALSTAVWVGEAKEWIPEMLERAKKLKVNAGWYPSSKSSLLGQLDVESFMHPVRWSQGVQWIKDTYLELLQLVHVCVGVCVLQEWSPVRTWVLLSPRRPRTGSVSWCKAEWMRGQSFCWTAAGLRSLAMRKATLLAPLFFIKWK